MAAEPAGEVPRQRIPEFSTVAAAQVLEEFFHQRLRVARGGPFSGEIDVRSNWDVEQTFDLSIPYTPPPPIKKEDLKKKKKQY